MCSDRRAITDNHRGDKLVGNMVDVEQATSINSIGDALKLGSVASFWVIERVVILVFGRDV
jgi:hypothetical protein